MPGRDKGGGGRSEEDRLRDLAARERARVDGKRPPPNFGPSTRAGRERAGNAAEPRVPSQPVPMARAKRDSSLEFDFAQPSTRAAGADRAIEPSSPAPRPAQPVYVSGESTTATVEAPRPSEAPESPAQPGAVPRVPGERGEGAPAFTPLTSPRARRERERSAKAPRAKTARSSRTRARSKPTGGAALLATARRNRVGLAACAAGAALLIGAISVLGGGDDAPQQQASAAAKPKGPSPYGTPTPTPLPPETRVVAYTGAPQAKELGILGTMPFEQAADRLERQLVPYERKSRPVLPAFDLIATIANAHPGPAGKYRTRQTSKVIARYLRAARRHDAALILDVQPGTSNFVDEIKPLERWLKEPDVHLALDPEWRMRPGVQPGSEIGWVSAGEVTATLNRVARIVRANKLPKKLVIVHRFTDGMIKDLPTVDVPKEVVGVISIDGVGTRAQKQATYDRIAPTLPKPWLAAFKVFYVEDEAAGGKFSGKQVMGLHPRPHVVLYE